MKTQCSCRSKKMNAMLGVFAALIVLPLLSGAVSSTANLTGGHYNAAESERALFRLRNVRDLKTEMMNLNAQCSSMARDTKSAVCQAYFAATDACKARQGATQDFACPEMRDVESILGVLNGSATLTPTEAEAEAAAAAALPATITDLEPEDRQTIRNSLAVGACSRKLPSALYLLCHEALIAQKKRNPGVYRYTDSTATDVQGMVPSGLDLRLRLLRSVYGK